MEKSFIITVDTEGDNLWNYVHGNPITTENAKYIPRFQMLCEKYGFKPVYLTNYEMANDDEFVKYAKEWLDKCNCEIGIHLHAWNNPPVVPLVGQYAYNPYLIEYSPEIMHEKFKVLYLTIKNRFGIPPVSHRAGRWAMNGHYYNILKEFGIKVDCSVTPHIDWTASKGVTMGGSDYSNAPEKPYMIGSVLEVPVSIRYMRHLAEGRIRHITKVLLLGENVWLRPALHDYRTMKKLIDKLDNECDTDYVEFMIHSSELMPGGSPYFKDGKSIERMYNIIDRLFKYAYEKGYRGSTLNDYYNKRKSLILNSFSSINGFPVR